MSLGCRLLLSRLLKAQMAGHFGMTEKMFRAAGADSLKSLPLTGEVER